MRGAVLLHTLVVVAALSLGLVAWLSLPFASRKLAPIVGHLRRELRFVRSRLSAEAVMWMACGSVAAAALCLPLSPTLASGLLALPLLPLLVLARARRVRVRLIEQQVEGFLGALARSLEAAPSLGDALAEAARVLDAPIADELRETLQELSLGRSLEEALGALGQRVGSRTVSLALVTIEVGRTTGGRLPAVLRSAAAALREMQRLEGVLRSKTADGRAQAVVIGIVPLPLYLGLRVMDPAYFAPLETTSLGHVILGVAILLWFAAILLTQRILAVDL